MTLTKAEITDRIYRKTDLRKSDANQAVETILEIIKSALESGEGRILIVVEVLMICLASSRFSIGCFKLT